MSPFRLAQLAAVALIVAACAGPAQGSAAPGSQGASTADAGPSPSASATASSTPVGSPDRPSAAATTSPSPTDEPSAVPTSTPATPSPEPTRPPVATATARPTAKPTAKPTARPTAKPTTRPTAKPTAKPVVLELEARDLLFAPAAIVAPADRPFGIEFRNADAAIPHNVTISTAGGTSRFSGQIISGVQSVTYVVPALPAGGYHVGCIVHPSMTAALTVR